LIAEYAIASQDGKLSVLGIFDQISSDAFPAGVPIFYVVTTLTAGPAEFGSEKRLGLALHHQDGQELMRDDKTITVQPAPMPGIQSQFNHIWTFPGVGFMKEGTYQFSVLVDDRTERTIPLYVINTSGGQR
jgi:hypothetical protein